MEFALNFYLGKKVVLFLVGRRNISFPEGERGSLIITESVGTLPLLWQKGVGRLEGKKVQIPTPLFYCFWDAFFRPPLSGKRSEGTPKIQPRKYLDEKRGDRNASFSLMKGENAITKVGR